MLWKGKQNFKGGGTFVCSECNVRGVQLNLVLGAWPPKMVSDMTEAALADFWCKLLEVHGTKRIKGFVMEYFTMRRIEREEAKREARISL